MPSKFFVNIFRVSICAVLLVSSTATAQADIDCNPFKKRAPPSKRGTPPLPLLHPRQANKSLLIVIDPGHGGEDCGARSISKPSYHEKNLNLTTAQMVKTCLEQLGYKTCLTRNDDVFIALNERAELANKRKSRLFVSVHYNSAPNRSAEGVEVYFYHSLNNLERSQKSQLLAKEILKYVTEKTQANPRGAKHGDFAVIRETDMPAVLVECGFLTNEKEMQHIKDPVYLKNIAWGIALGIHAYLQKCPRRDSNARPVA